jgi:hypothetical protein
LYYNIIMKNIQNQTKFDTTFSINNDTHEKDEKNGEIELINNKNINKCETKYNYHDDSSDDLSEFTQYRDRDFESDDDLEDTFDFIFDFDIIYKPKINIELLQIIEIKNKIVKKIKLNALELLFIKKLDDSEKFELLKLFNHMV